MFVKEKAVKFAGRDIKRELKHFQVYGSSLFSPTALEEDFSVSVEVGRMEVKILLRSKTVKVENIKELAEKGGP